MPGDFYQRWSARSSPRFRMFAEAKEAYESFIQRTGVRFDEMSEEDYRHAREDGRLNVAALNYAAAIEMSEGEGALSDVAVAKYQLGLLRHIRGEFEEAKALMEAALKVMSSLPNRDVAEGVSNCRYHLGVIALKQGRLSEAVRELQQARLIDEARADFGGVRLCELALAACADAGTDVKEALPSRRARQTIGK